MKDYITLRHAAEQARKALKFFNNASMPPEVRKPLTQTLAALDAALAEPEPTEIVAEQGCAFGHGWLRFALPADKAALDAALGAEMSATVARCRQPATEPDAKPKPVAWWHPARGFSWAASDVEVPPTTLPLYAAPPKPDAKPEPATNKEIDAEWLKIKPVFYPMDNLSDFHDGFRAAERFHGIKTEDKT